MADHKHDRRPMSAPNRGRTQFGPAPKEPAVAAIAIWNLQGEPMRGAFAFVKFSCTCPRCGGEPVVGLCQISALIDGVLFLHKGMKAPPDLAALVTDLGFPCIELNKPDSLPWDVQFFKEV